MNIFLFVIATGIAYITLKLYKYYKEQKKIHKYLDQFPGDPYWPLIGSTWRFLNMKREDTHEVIKSVFKDFGPTFRIYVGDIPILFTSKVEHFEGVFKDTVNITKGEGYKFIVPWLGNGLITSSGDIWNNHRKVLNPAFHYKVLDKYSEVFSRKALELAKILREQASKGSDYIDIYPYITNWALDVITETAMGIKSNCLAKPQPEYAKGILELCELFALRSTKPWLQIDFIFFNLTKSGATFQKYNNLLKDTNMKIIAERKAEFKKLKQHTKIDDFGRKEKLALLDILLENQEENTFTDEEINDEVSTFMFAGQDTTSNTVTFALFNIANHPEVQSKIHEELDNIFRGEEREVTPQDISKMDYLERVVKETLRMFSPVPSISRKLVKDIILDGKVIPAGVDVQLCINQMHHQPEYWPNPEIFDPDRFLLENSMNRHPYAFSPFSAGLRNCIGQKFGTRNAKTVLATLLRTFQISCLETMESLKIFEEVVLRPQTGPHIKFEVRRQ